MSADLAINTTAGAFVAGLVTSLHCAGMCGPLLCAALPKPGISYHAGRFLSYGALGAVCGAIGSVPLQRLMKSPLIALPWVLVALLLIIALGFKPKIPRPMFLRKWYARRLIARSPGPASAAGAAVSASAGAKPGSGRWKGLTLGLITPLLPCAPLYLMLGACLVAGSAFQGLQFALAFVLGTVPMLWAAHGSLGMLTRRISPRRMMQLQRGLALGAAVLLAWRLKGTLEPQPDGAEAAVSCPLCHD